MSDIAALNFEEAHFLPGEHRVVVFAHPPAGPRRVYCVPRELIWSSDDVRIVSLLLARERGDTLSLLDVPHETQRRLLTFHEAGEPYVIREGDRIRLTMAVVTQHGILRANANELVVQAALSGLRTEPRGGSR